MNEVSIEKIIQLVTQEVVSQLRNNGVTVTINPAAAGRGITNALAGGGCSLQRRTERVDMSKYKTPILTERHVGRVHELTGKIIIPRGTIVTPKARETAKRKQIFIEIE